MDASVVVSALLTGGYTFFVNMIVPIFISLKIYQKNQSKWTSFFAFFLISIMGFAISFISSWYLAAIPFWIYILLPGVPVGIFLMFKNKYTHVFILQKGLELVGIGICLIGGYKVS